MLLFSALLLSAPSGKISGEADPAPIETAIDTRKHAFRQCAKQAKGEMIVRFSIGAGGKVQSATVAKSTLKNEEVERCVVDVVKTITFDPPTGQALVVNFPFEFGVDPKKKAPDRISQSTVAAVLDLAQTSFRTCYAKQLTKKPDLQGKQVTLVFKIDDAGTAEGARVAESQHDLPNINECLIDVAHTLKFPKPRDGEVAKVTYPVVIWPGPIDE